MKNASFRVVGVSFVEGYPENLWRLRDLAEERTTIGRMEPIPASLKRNPENRHDGNAIEVHVPSLDAMIGHVPREIAARLAPLLDSGEEWKAEVVFVAIREDHPERPGIEIRCAHVDLPTG